jgi:tetratricopeptide (TPR) repeat protein
LDPRSASDPAETLEQARSLAAARDWAGLAALTQALPQEQLRAAPELGYLCADALHRTGMALAALDLAQAVAPALRAGGDRRATLRLQNLIGAILYEAGRLDEAEHHFSALLDDATRWQDDEFVARASNNLGVLANIRGQREVALTCYERALAAYQRLGHMRGLAQTQYNLGISYRDLGQAEEADARYRKAIHYASRSGSEDVVALGETERAALRIAAGDGSLAEQWLGRAQLRFETLGDPVRRAEVLRVRAGAARVRGEASAARQHLEEAFGVAVSQTNLLLRAEVQRDRGLLLLELGMADEARAALLDAAESYERMGAAAEADAVRGAAGVHDGS